MKILFVIPTLSCGGAEVLTCGLALELAERGHKVKILCHLPLHASHSMIPDRKKLEDSVEVVVCKDTVDFHFLRPTVVYVPTLRKILDEFGPDVVHSNLFFSELYSRSLIHPNATYITHVHDNMFQLKAISWKTFFSKKLLVSAWERFWILKKYKASRTRFLAISPDVRTFLHENLPLSLHNITYIPNAINLKRFAGKKSSFMADGILNIISVGSLVKKKNHALLISLSSLLKEQRIPHRIDVYGEGPLRAQLEEEVAKQSLENSIFFHGNSGEIPQKMHASDLYIHPATYEPFGLVLLEAMASGLPVISLDGYGNRELIREGYNGFLLPNDATAHEIKNKIDWFLEEPTRFVEIAENGLGFCLDYSMQVYANKLIDLYRRA
jgi:glycosyltransferase involved in cell wall biosynthesis